MVDTINLCLRFLNEHRDTAAANDLRTMGAFWIMRMKEDSGATSSKSLKQESAIRQTSQAAKAEDEQVSKADQSKKVVA